MAYIQPSIYIKGIEIAEPVTTLTDLLISAICMYAFVKLQKVSAQHNIHTYLKFYFLSLAIATFLGGIIGHGFFYLFSFAWKLPGWLISMFSIALVERATILYGAKLIKPQIAVFFSWLNIVELLLFVTLTFSTLNFFFVEIHTTYGLLIVVNSFSIYTYIKTKSKGSLFFIIAVGFSAAGALFFINKWGVGPWLNHFDISHLWLAGSAWFFYKGSILIVADSGSLPK